MTVGIGQTDPVEPGGEDTRGTGVASVATQVPFGTLDGIIGLFDDETYYDGYSLSGTISTVTTDATTGLCKLTMTAAIFDTAKRYNGCWFVMTSGAADGKWYQINQAESTTAITLLDLVAASFTGVATDTLEIGKIHAYRDFAVQRARGSAKLTGIKVDHEDAEGSASNAQMQAQVFTQGLRPRDPLSLAGTATIDESARNGVWYRLGYDTSPTRAPRSSRCRLRLVFKVRAQQIKVRHVRLRGKEWPR